MKDVLGLKLPGPYELWEDGNGAWWDATGVDSRSIRDCIASAKGRLENYGEGASLITRIVPVALVTKELDYAPKVERLDKKAKK